MSIVCTMHGEISAEQAQRAYLEEYILSFDANPHHGLLFVPTCKLSTAILQLLDILKTKLSLITNEIHIHRIEINIRKEQKASNFVTAFRGDFARLNPPTDIQDCNYFPANQFNHIWTVLGKVAESAAEWSMINMIYLKYSVSKEWEPILPQVASFLASKTRSAALLNDFIDSCIVPTMVSKHLFVFAKSMQQLCASLRCNLFEDDAFPALLGKGNGGRVYRVWKDYKKGRRLCALKIVGIADEKSALADKTKREYDIIRRMKKIVPDHVLGVCGRKIISGTVTVVDQSDDEDGAGPFQRYLGYLMPVVGEPIQKGTTLSEEEVFLILRSLFTFHCHGEYHGSARLDNVVYNQEKGLYQWIDFRPWLDQSFFESVVSDMIFFFKSLRKYGWDVSTRVCDFWYGEKTFNGYASYIAKKKSKDAWKEVEQVMTKISVKKG